MSKVTDFAAGASKFLTALGGGAAAAISAGLLSGTAERWTTGGIAVGTAILVYYVPNSKSKSDNESKLPNVDVIHGSGGVSTQFTADHDDYTDVRPQGFPAAPPDYVRGPAQPPKDDLDKAIAPSGITQPVLKPEVAEAIASGTQTAKKVVAVKAPAKKAVAKKAPAKKTAAKKVAPKKAT